MNKKFRLKKTLWLTLFFGVSFAYFIWLVWNKLTDLIGDSDKVLVVLLFIILFGLFTGNITINKIIKEFGG